MKRFLATLALVLVPVVAQAQAGPLTAPPFIDQQTHAILFDSMLAIARANVVNPSAAATASLSYQAAIQRLQMGDISGARHDAAYALGQAGRTSTTIPIATSEIDAIFAPLRALEHPLFNLPFTDARHDLQDRPRGNPCATLTAPDLRAACAAAVLPSRQGLPDPSA